MPRPERDEHAALAIVAALQSDPSGRTVHAGSNPYVPLLNGNFDMVRAARAADAAFKQWDAAYAVDKAAVDAAMVSTPVTVIETQEERAAAALTRAAAQVVMSEATQSATQPVA